MDNTGKHWDSLLPPLVRNVSGAFEVVLASKALAGKELIGLYFSAPWCGYCVRFTPYLNALYNQAPKDKLEIIFVSSCTTPEEHDSYTSDMPWYWLSYGDASRIGYIRKAIRDQTGRPQGKLATLFGINSLPSLVILDKHGRVVRQDGRQDFQTQSQLVDVLKVWENSLHKAAERSSALPWAAAGGLGLLGLGGAYWLHGSRGSKL